LGRKIKDFYRLSDILGFGRHASKSIYEVLVADKQYVEWAILNTSGFLIDEPFEDPPSMQRRLRILGLPQIDLELAQEALAANIRKVENRLGRRPIINRDEVNEEDIEDYAEDYSEYDNDDFNDGWYDVLPDDEAFIAEWNTD
jgi:hypothetical protein